MGSREFPGTLEAAADAEAWVSGESRALGLAGETVFAINLCVEELFLNAVKHGRARATTISLWAEPDGPRLEFVDDGAAFDPTLAPVKRVKAGVDFEIGGFGTGLVKRFARRMTYRRTQGENRLVLEFDGRLGQTSNSGAPPAE